MAQQYHFHFYGGPPGPLPVTGPSPPVTVISTPGDVRHTRSESVHPPPRRTIADSKSATQQTRPSCLRVCRPNWSSEPEQFRNRSRRRRRRHHHRRHDEVPDQAARPMSAPAEPRPVHTFPPPAVQGICLPDHARALVLRYSRLLIFAVRMQVQRGLQDNGGLLLLQL